MRWKNFVRWKENKIKNLDYCFKCRKNTESKNPEVSKTKSGRIMLLSKCEMCNSKNQIFLKNTKLEDYSVAEGWEHL